MRDKMFLALMLCIWVPFVWGKNRLIEENEQVLNYLGYSITGEKVKASDFEASVVLLSFWATWCGPCLAEIPLLIELQEATPTSKLQIVAINYRESQQRVDYALSLIQDTKLFWVSDPWGVYSERFGLTGIPLHIILRSDGTVARVFSGYSKEQFVEMLEALEAELVGSQ